MMYNYATTFIAYTITMNKKLIFFILFLCLCGLAYRYVSVQSSDGWFTTQGVRRPTKSSIVSKSKRATKSVCGNWRVENTEQCDDGNLLDYDGCSKSCKKEICGDGIQQIGEQCDDGNTIDNDGCNAQCFVECPDVPNCPPMPSCPAPASGCAYIDIPKDSAGCVLWCGTLECIPSCWNALIEWSEQCDDGNMVNNDGCSTSCELEYASLELTVLLQGPLVGSAWLMDDMLREKQLIPLTVPYTARWFPFATSNTEISSEMLAIAWSQALVDRVLIELRPSLQRDWKERYYPALLRRDGSVVDTTGLPLRLELWNGTSQYVIVHHRNHLPVMSATPVQFAYGTTTVVNFADGSTPTYGTNAQKAIENLFAMRAGDVNHDAQVLYEWTNNDAEAILTRVWSETPLNIVPGYFDEDVNMNGEVKYNGAGNDRAIILVNIGPTTPSNIIYSQVP